MTAESPPAAAEVEDGGETFRLEAAGHLRVDISSDLVGGDVDS